MVIFILHHEHLVLPGFLVGWLVFVPFQWGSNKWGADKLGV
jgi:hypothetical protein